VHYDVEVAGAKYFQALGDGEVPLTFLFSGTVFTRGSSEFGVEQIPWHHEAGYRLPVAVWRDLMAAHFPGQAWLRARPGDPRRAGPLPRHHMHTGWDETLTALLAAARERVGEVTGPASTGVRPSRTRSLYEGYLLYPVPRHVGQEPGALAVRGARAAGRRGRRGARPRRRSVSSSRRRRRRSGCYLRFLHLQVASVERRGSSASYTPCRS
jgi:hypothetical protein